MASQPPDDGMPVSNYRRYRVEGATYFFTLVADGRQTFLCHDDSRALLRRLLIECRKRWPFTIDAIVLLPDHLHTLWTLPEGDSRYSMRWAWIKKECTKGWLSLGNKERPVSPGRRHKRQHGVLQPRFWEHLIRDDADFETHADYTHYNPVKHGYVSAVKDWPWSTFHQWVKEGIYPEDWGIGVGERIGSVRDTVGE